MVSEAHLVGSAAPVSGTNPALAPRMAVIGFLAFNFAITCVYGSYGVLIGPIETKMAVTRDLSSLGLSLVLLAVALASPVVGVLSGRYSIRFLMIGGTVLMIGGFIAAGNAHGIFSLLVAYALLIGPGMCVVGTMLPSTLVTRWYQVNRGRALGLVNMPILTVVGAPLIALAVRERGLSGTFFLLAGAMLLLLVPLLFIRDYPPGDEPQDMDRQAVKADPAIGVGQLLATGRFWALSIAFAAVMTGATILSAHLIPMTMGWGVNATGAATLLSASSLGGMAGSIIFGWVTDRLGGAKALAILCVNSALLWAALLLRPPFAYLIPIAALLGLHGAAVTVGISMAFSERFGQASFARAFGLSNLVNLPFMVLGVPLAAHVYVRTGSYAGALAGLIGFLLIGAVATTLGGQARPTT